MKKISSAVLFTVLTVFMFSGSATADEGKGQKTITIQVDGLSCPFCAYGLEKKLLDIDGVEKLNIDVNSGKVELYLKENAVIDTALIREKVDEAGFTPRDILSPDKTEKTDDK